MDSELAIGNRNALCGIIAAAKEFADSEYQQRIWIDGEGPEMSSYREALCRIFDDAHVEDFLHGDAMRYGFSQQMQDKLGRFAELLDEFDRHLPPDIGSAEIVRRENWKNVSEAAGGFLNEAAQWYQQNCADF
jgi:hypothetical protein